jgi:hypothetical protein
MCPSVHRTLTKAWGGYWPQRPNDSSRQHNITHNSTGTEGITSVIFNFTFSCSEGLWQFRPRVPLLLCGYCCLQVQEARCCECEHWSIAIVSMALHELEVNSESPGIRSKCQMYSYSKKVVKTNEERAHGHLDT